ncbi:MAG: hypothetical protein ABSE16_00325 [Verrucomicrobiota bacterium]
MEILVLADDDQALAAEPGFHHDPPQGGRTEAISLRRCFEHRSEPRQEQPENGPALAQRPAQAL